jgi:phenylacetic acid degradation protein paaN
MADLFEKHSQIINQSIEALKVRTYYSPYPENPKQYDEALAERAKSYLSSIMNNNFTELSQSATTKAYVGGEVSPFLQLGLGIMYPKVDVDEIVKKGHLSIESWSRIDSKQKLGILIEALERIKDRFFDIAYATMHTTGQSFMMSFQASGPHSNDRALEATIVAYLEVTKYMTEAKWVKPMGKFDLTIKKTWKPIPKGLGLAIGCSTFPIWNTVPAIFANLMTGNACIVKPHPKAILPIAIVVGELQKTLVEFGADADLVQLAADDISEPITKKLAEHADINLIDFTGSSVFGNYIESLKNKTVFTEKAGVNSIIIDSVDDLHAVAGNIAFSACLYSGQMCTAPQNIFIPSEGIITKDGILSYDECVGTIVNAVNGLVHNPKAGAATLGAIQTDDTVKRVKGLEQELNKVLLASGYIKNEEFVDARTLSPSIIELSHNNKEVFGKECFGPVLFIIKTDNTEHSIELAKELAKDKGALTCSAYTTDASTMNRIEREMNNIYVPVSFNFIGAAFINSHAAFSDLHVTGGNAAGNASLTNTEFVARRFVWVGNRYC